MKIKLTESQLKKAKLITEAQERVNTFFEKSDDIKERVNRLYTKITFSTLAEILEGDLDLSIIAKQLDQYRTVMNTHYRRADDFFEHMPEDDYYEKFERLHSKVQDTFQDVVYKKVDILDDLVAKLNDFTESDIEDQFKDIKRLDI